MAEISSWLSYWYLQNETREMDNGMDNFYCLCLLFSQYKYTFFSKQSPPFLLSNKCPGKRKKYTKKSKVCIIKSTTNDYDLWKWNCSNSSHNPWRTEAESRISGSLILGNGSVLFVSFFSFCFQYAIHDPMLIRVPSKTSHLCYNLKSSVLLWPCLAIDICFNYNEHCTWRNLFTSRL